MKLLDLQREFGACLRTDDPAVARTRFGPAAGLLVYRHTYRAQLIACLEEIFARTRSWLGDEGFRPAALAHIANIPPSSWTLDAYGTDFPATLASLYPDDPEVGELAWLDLALAEAFVAADAEPATADALARADCDRVGIAFVPSLDLAAAATNSAEIWQALENGALPPAVETLREAGAHLVWRQDFVPKFRLVGAVEHRAILLLRAGARFRDLCEDLAAEFGEADGIRIAGEMLGDWLRQGLIAALPV